MTFDERQIYDLRNKNYRESLEEEHPSWDGSVARRPEDEEAASGAGEVTRELEDFNRRFGRLKDRVETEVDKMDPKGKEETHRLHALKVINFDVRRTVCRYVIPMEFITHSYESQG